MTRYDIQPGDIEVLGNAAIESPWFVQGLTSSDALERYVIHLQRVSGGFYDAARVLCRDQPLFVLTALQREAARVAERSRSYHALLLHARKLEERDEAG